MYHNSTQHGFCLKNVFPMIMNIYVHHLFSLQKFNHLDYFLKIK